MEFGLDEKNQGWRMKATSGNLKGSWTNGTDFCRN